MPKASWSRPSLSVAVAVMLAVVGRVQAALDPIVIKGSKFFNNNTGEQFYIKGVSYQQSLAGIGLANSFIDPLADASGCQRDVPYLTKLGVNVVRVYAISPDLSHDDCMNLFADAGIYVLSDLGGAGQSVDVSIQYADPEWNNALFERYAHVIDALHGYTNTLGFFAGNEVVNSSSTAAAAFVKAATRDMKNYISDKGYRTIGVGYSGNADPTLLNTADYFACGDESDTADFYGINDYSWCGDSSIDQSGYSDLISDFSSYPVPIFFSEYGCNTPEPRTFTEVQAIYGSQMTPFLSGGVVYEYFEEKINFGLVSVNGDSVSVRDDYNNLQSQLASATPSSIQMSAYNPSNSPPACPTSSWSVTSVLPTPPSEAVAANAAAVSTTSAVGSGSSSTSSGNGATPASNALSSGATIGIGVGVGLGGALIIGALVAFFCIRRRRRKQWPAGDTSPDMAQASRPGVPEADSNARAELEHNHYYGAEMPASRDPQEMPNERYGPPKDGTGIQGRHELSAANENVE